MIIGLTFFSDKILDNLCNHTASSVGAVICGHVKITCYRFELILKDYEILGLCTDDDICINAVLMEPFYLRINRCCTNTSGYEYHFLFLKFFDVKSFAVMAFMMIGGIALRSSGVVPECFIAVFYTGLGASLLLAGVLFGVNFGKAMSAEGA